MTDEKKPETVADDDLDEVQGAGAGVSPFITRDETDVSTFHGSDFNAAMGNSSRSPQVQTTVVKKGANNGEGWNFNN